MSAMVATEPVPSGSPVAALPDVPEASGRQLQGDLAVWIFILAELLAFAVFFLAYAFSRARHVELFNASQLTLDRASGAINTLLLLAASALVVAAVRQVMQGLRKSGSRYLLAALACGAGFLCIKGLEFKAKFAAGISLSSNTFYMFYLSLTGFHFLHVLLGMAILFILWRQTLRGEYGPEQMNGLESGAAYWHMVDLVWLVLFPLVYVLR